MTVFQQEHYLENFVQATFDALPGEKLSGLGHRAALSLGIILSSLSLTLSITLNPMQISSFNAGSTLVVSGDGRYLTKPSVATIVRMAAANGVGKVRQHAFASQH